jgi:tetratricopeptide (TPR) repeat protein
MPALAAMSAIHPALSQNLDSRPKKVMLLPPQVFVFELSAGGVPTRMADWEATARDNITTAATRLARESGLFELIPTPPLAAAALEQLDAHIGLYDRVAQSVFIYGRGEQAAWAHKKNAFDYTVGLERAPQFAPVHRALGLLYYKRGDTALAVSRLRRYLELAPAAPDRGHVEYYLSSIEKQPPHQEERHPPP